tara:strand:+ start:33 stop:782 length:750 start_codon:yes stop_codon:yes gene_type:complete
MINLFRKYRQNLLLEGKKGKYLKYAIGEIFLVVIGILIALQINNANELRKNRALLRTNIQSIAKDISADTILIKSVIKVLNTQIVSGKVIIPIMESDQKEVTDSLAFILAFNSMTSAPHITENETTWNYLNASGIIAEFPDKKLLKMLQEFYYDFRALTTNYSDSGIPGRLEIRRLKYELFSDTDHRKFFPTKTPEAPSKEVYYALFNDKRVLPLCRFISSTSIYFESRFESLQSKAEKIISYINKNYK